MIIVGLSGSIATGKSTVGAMFQELGVPVYEADKIVHAFYAGPEAALIDAAFPGTLIEGAIDRQKLGKHVLGNDTALKTLENIVHPLVRKKFHDLATTHAAEGTPVIIFDIPLLLENGRDEARTRYSVDKIIVTYCDSATQRQRALARERMTEQKLNAILAKQLSQDEKRQLADFTLDTGLSLEKTREDVKTIFNDLTQSKSSKL